MRLAVNVRARQALRRIEDKLRQSAATKGATHLVITSVDTYGVSLQDAKAPGSAYECPR